MKVIFTNGEEHIIPTQALDDLIRENKIVAFLRSDGWTVIGRDPIRQCMLPEINTGDRWSDSTISRTEH